jgi:hypothetical protein
MGGCILLWEEMGASGMQNVAISLPSITNTCILIFSVKNAARSNAYNLKSKFPFFLITK